MNDACAQTPKGSDEHPWSLGAIARMVKATVAGISPEDWRLVSSLIVSGVVLDSRRIHGGEIFIALGGERVDGHEFIGEAFDQGAAAVVARRAWWSRRKAARAKGVHLLVEDPLAALQAWAGALRARIAPRVLAITGSSGKTSTKEMALALLREQEGGVVGTLGNRNNEIGLPWSLLQLRSADRWAVLELGANRPGEIARLVAVARPDAALITCIGRAHVGPFGSVEQILAAKLELLEALPPEGTVIIPDDDSRLERAVAERWSGRVLRFGWSPQADVRAGEAHYQLDGTELTLADPVGQTRINLLGEAGVRAALAALAGVRALGVEHFDLQSLGRVPALAGRLDPVQTAAGVTWILDMYNASPESVLHGLRFLSVSEISGRRIFVFGGMRELGDEAEAIHREVGRAAGGCDAGLFLGEEARITAPEAQKAGVSQVLWSNDPKDVVRFLRDYLKRGDVVYLKGARAAALEQVATALGVIGPEYGEEGL
ncbi:MAG: UDP-N-acetylmuramoyl-tripeptide--D-alanyl-D-alanine ligase [Candidatus Eisenbacteria sp.]|nr:UDP-N-acetylmuramoyl-tripeptide--D-alanyl-D-alanine ligase [Candidatus Eisenbacteria bacterium]